VTGSGDRHRDKRIRGVERGLAILGVVALLALGFASAGALARATSLLGTHAAINAALSGGNESANLDQCANGNPLSSTACNSSNASDWVNGNLGSSKATYFEGDSIPYRMSFDNLGAGSHTVTIQWDTTKSGKHAIDYLTTYTRTVTSADACAGRTGCGSPSTFPIPVDPNVTGGGVTPVAGNFTLYNGTISSVSSYSLTGSYSGDSSTSITITFTATGSSATLAWGGHIASRADWGLNNAAVNISGSPYHTRLLDLDGSGGNQDRSLSADAVIFPGFIHIVKTATGGNSTFSYTASPSPLADFTITTSGGTGEHDFNGIKTFTTYTVNEGTPPTGWTFVSLNCSVAAGTANGGTQTVSGAQVTIDLKEGEEVTCTYTNNLANGTVEVKKVLSPSNDAGLFNLQIDGTTQAANVGNGGDTTAKAATPGSHTVGETAGTGTSLGSYSTTWSCSDGSSGTGAGPVTVSVASNQNLVCTFTNTRNTGTIEVKKTLVPSSDAGMFDLSVDGAVKASGVGNGGTTGAVSVNTGTHAASEAAHAGTLIGDYTSTWSCSTNGGAATTGSGTSISGITVAKGDAVVCTFTNTRKAQLTVVKNANGGNGTFSFTSTGGLPSPATAGGAFSLTTVSGTKSQVFANLVPGPYSVAESGLPSGWSFTSLSCVDDSSKAAVGQVTGQSVSLRLAAGEAVTCTFANTLTPPPTTPPPPSTPPQPVIDLAITKTGAPNPTTTGTNITWTMVVTNNGPDTATGINLADPLPAGTTFVSVTTTQGSCAGGTLITCLLGNLAKGGSITITLVTSATTVGTDTNTATVVGNESESNTANNRATASVVVNAPPAPFKPPTPKPKPPVYCAALMVHPGSLFAGRHAVLTMKVTKHSKAVAGIKVRISGAGLLIVTQATDGKGIVKRAVLPKKAGIVTFRPVAQKSCKNARVGVIGVFTPPVTG